MGIFKNEVNAEARGGTELLIEEFERHVDLNLAEPFHIIPSRKRGSIADKRAIYWAHDLIGDPECDHLKHGGHNLYEKIVFVSNWQMQQFIAYYNIPWSKCVVIQNAIEPLEKRTKKPDVIKIIYHTTPHRGLEILTPVFDKLCEDYNNIELDVYSSFNIYGWGQRDEQYKQVFDQLKANPKVNYHGAVPYESVRQGVTNADIFAYPSIWQETSCRSLMEAMSAGLLCVHPNYGCLAETAANWTWMYQYNEDKNRHAGIFYMNLRAAIDSINSPQMETTLLNQSAYANIFYSWNQRKHQWNSLLQGMLNANN